MFLRVSSALDISTQLLEFSHFLTLSFEKYLFLFLLYFYPQTKLTCLWGPSRHLYKAQTLFPSSWRMQAYHSNTLGQVTNSNSNLKAFLIWPMMQQRLKNEQDSFSVTHQMPTWIRSSDTQIKVSSNISDCQPLPAQCRVECHCL